VARLFSGPFLSDVVSAAFDGLIVHDGSVILDANERAAKMFGYDTPDAMVGLPYYVLVSPSLRAVTAERVNTQSEGQYSLLGRRVDGDEFFVHVNAKETVHKGNRARVVAFRYGGDRSIQGDDITQRSLALERTVKALAATIEQRDTFTAGHQSRVAELGERIAGALQMSDREITTIRIAGNIHDIGKIAVPAEILMKPEALNDEEYKLVKRHPEAGFRIIHSVDFDGPVHETILQHHERLDGSGYPAGTLQPIPEAQILAVADVYDALTSSRPYRAGKSPADAIAIMKEEEQGRLEGDAVKALSSLVLN